MISHQRSLQQTTSQVLAIVQHWFELPSQTTAMVADIKQALLRVCMASSRLISCVSVIDLLFDCWQCDNHHNVSDIIRLTALPCQEAVDGV